MIDYSPLLRQLRGTQLERWADLLPDQLEQAFRQRLHGDFPRWMECVRQLPMIPADQIDLNSGTVAVRSNQPPNAQIQRQTEDLLRQLHPWRKGPYDIHGIRIDTEWRSDWKWDRLAPHIAPLEGRRVLDVGCGNGYHCWRMAGAGAGLVIGIDPTQLFLAQFLALRWFLGDEWPVHLLPLGVEAVPENLEGFDTVFSMGVLYHRRSPLDHLFELKGCLRAGGELVLETLVVDGEEDRVLVPKGRYAKMRNVWFIPSPATLAQWLQRCGFHHIRIVDVTTTRIDEQRSTDWMRFESLPDYLDSDDRSRTVEGYPAPRRAILIANAPGTEHQPIAGD